MLECFKLRLGIPFSMLAGEGRWSEDRAAGSIVGKVALEVAILDLINERGCSWLRELGDREAVGVDTL